MQAFCELVGARSTLSAAVNAVESLFDLCDRHAFTDRADGFEIAVTAADKRDVVNDIAVQVEFYETCADALGVYTYSAA